MMLERAAAQKKGANCSEKPSQPTEALLEVRTKADLPQDWAQTQNSLGVVLRELGGQLEGEEGLKTLRESVDLLREVVSLQPDDASRYRLALALGTLAFKLILDRQFAEAQTQCEEAQRLANGIGDQVEKTDRDNLIFIQRNLAHALLFQGQYDEAVAIYRQNWEKLLNGRTFGEITLEDFAAFDEAGLTHPDLSRMNHTMMRTPTAIPSIAVIISVAALRTNVRSGIRAVAAAWSLDAFQLRPALV
jgi:tetratricopeptide (TPR) repeat protein